MLTGLILAAALSTSHMPPGAPVVDHSQPSHYAQPTIRRFERRAVDNARKMAYKAYCADLDRFWKTYRSKGSTDEAFEEYVSSAAAAKARYVIGDPYYSAFYDDGSPNGNGLGGGLGACGAPCCDGAPMSGKSGVKGSPVQQASQK